MSKMFRYSAKLLNLFQIAQNVFSVILLLFSRVWFLAQNKCDIIRLISTSSMRIFPFEVEISEIVLSSEERGRPL